MPPRGRRPNTVRIIAGEWRGRRLRFPDLPGLRPSSDRRRETLFNWLAPHLAGARCLDLFAGSGALAFEALSRGAASAVLVEVSAAAVASLAESQRTLAAAARSEIVHAPALRYLRGPAEPFELVFVDPPFARPGLAAEACARLADGWLAPSALVYLEASAHAGPPEVPADWRLWRESVAGDARALLYSVAGQD